MTILLGRLRGDLTMVNDPRFMTIGEEFWRKYLDNGSGIKWILRRADWGRLLERVFEAGFNEGSSEERE